MIKNIFLIILLKIYFLTFFMKIKENKTNLSYEFFENENKDSDVILILHGWQGASSSWTEVGKKLSEKWYHVIIPDLPCASKLSNCNDIYNLDDFAEIIEKFIDDLKTKYPEINFDNLILWGHSNWWAISIKLANRKNIKILRLILNNSAWIRNDKKRSFKRKILKLVTSFLAPFLKGDGSRRLKKLRELFYKAIWSHDYLKAEKNPNLKQTYLNMISSDLKDEIKNIDNHTLLIRWEKDNYTPVSDAHFMRNNIKNSKLIILDNETHWIHLKNPDRLVETFLQNI